MENRIIFREMLTEIKKAADASGNVITRDEIRALLAGLPLEEEHYRLIYEYLDGQNIRVVESKEELEEVPREEGGRSLSIYLDELMKLEKETFPDEHTMLEQAIRGEREARTRLVESYLPLVCEMAGDYEGDEIAAEDLIQEGNLGLLTAMESLQEFESAAACRAHILNSINEAMEHAIQSGKDSRKMDEGIVSRVNHLNEAVQNLERDLEHKVSAEELSAYLEMPLEEIRDILRMSGDQIEIDGNGSE